VNAGNVVGQASSMSDLGQTRRRRAGRREIEQRVGVSGNTLVGVVNLSDQLLSCNGALTARGKETLRISHVDGCSGGDARLGASGGSSFAGLSLPGWVGECRIRAWARWEVTTRAGTLSHTNIVWNKALVSSDKDERSCVQIKRLSELHYVEAARTVRTEVVPSRISVESGSSNCSHHRGSNKVTREVGEEVRLRKYAADNGIIYFCCRITTYCKILEPSVVLAFSEREEFMSQDATSSW